jgi:hypothetical protein
MDEAFDVAQALQAGLIWIAADQSSLKNWLALAGGLGRARIARTESSLGLQLSMSGAPETWTGIVSRLVCLEAEDQCVNCAR